MKKLLAGISLLGFAALASAQSITFEQTTLDYGTIKKGSDGNRTFVVKNTGDKPLIIEKVKPSCGCTTPEWSKEPILPGKTGKIAVHYNTNLVNPFQKLIEVYSNDPKNSRSVIYIKGTVVDDGTKAVEMKAKPAVAAEKLSKKAVK
ncbi:DUF1573 domain-containing protein [Weeksellaceae bacterium A-14]|uniref:DUF1573 domain-containing protein n=1 Tax=Daejeonia sp. YH14 TaxID=3439042 RepID=UPI0031E4C8E8